MRHDLFWSSRDHERSTSKFDLRSGHGNDLSRSCCISVNASRQDKQFRTFPMSLSLFYQKLWTENVHYYDTLWRHQARICTFLPITFDRKEIETWGRSQFVSFSRIIHRLQSSDAFSLGSRDTTLPCGWMLDSWPRATAPPGRACRVVGGAARQDQVQRRMSKFFLIHGFTVAFRIVYIHLHILGLYPAGTNYSSDFPSSLIVSWTVTDANLSVRKMSRAVGDVFAAVYQNCVVFMDEFHFLRPCQATA